MKPIIEFVTYTALFMVTVVLALYFFYPPALGRDIARAVKAYNAEMLNK